MGRNPNASKARYFVGGQYQVYYRFDGDHTVYCTLQGSSIWAICSYRGMSFITHPNRSGTLTEIDEQSLPTTLTPFRMD